MLKIFSTMAHDSHGLRIEVIDCMGKKRLH